MGPLESLLGAFGSMPGSKPSTPKRTGKAKAAAEDADYYVTIANLMVMGMVGYEAQVADHERHLIVEGLSDILQNDERITKAAGYLRPLSLVMGAGMWSVRCFAIWLGKHPDNFWTRRQKKAQNIDYTQPPPFVDESAQYYYPQPPIPPDPGVTSNGLQDSPLLAGMQR